MVQNLGNSYVAPKKNDNTKIIEYDCTESQPSNYNSNELQAIYSKCEYLETLNQNLVSENAKLKLQLENEVRNSKQLKIELRSNSGSFDYSNLNR